MTVLFLCSEIRDNGLIGRYFDCVESAARGAPGSLVGRSGGAARDDGFSLLSC